MELWFDDGLLDVYNNIYPIMKKYNQVGILSLVTGSVGKYFKWRTNFVEEGYLMLPCMSIEQIKELMKEGWSIASHTVTHPHLLKIPFNKAIKEIVYSKIWIQENLKVEPIAFVPPWHEISENLKAVVLQYYPRIAHRNRRVWHACSGLPPPDDWITPEIFEERLKKLIGI